MNKIDKADGSKDHAKPLVIIADTVYLHTNISYVEENLYSYTEYQLSISEFLTQVFSTLDVEKLLDDMEVKA